MNVETYQLIFSMFTCAFHLEISLFFQLKLWVKLAVTTRCGIFVTFLYLYFLFSCLLTAYSLFQITRDLFDVLDETIQQNLLTSVIQAASDCDVPDVGSAASRAIKKIVVDGKLIAVEIEKMKNAQVPLQEQSTPSVRRRR